jgi:hypothetical protein
MPTESPDEPEKIPREPLPAEDWQPLRYLEKVSAMRQQRTCQHIRARCTLCA